MQWTARAMLAIAGLLSITRPAPVVAQQTSAPITVEKLLAEGWEVAGYIAVADNRSLILFKHRDRRHLVQCSVLVDATRNPRVVTFCYEIR